MSQLDSTRFIVSTCFIFLWHFLRYLASGYAHSLMDFIFCPSASTERRVLLPGEVWRKPLQHVSLAEVQLVCWAEKERTTQSRTRHPLRSEGHLLPAKAARECVKATWHPEPRTSKPLNGAQQQRSALVTILKVIQSQYERGEDRSTCDYYNTTINHSNQASWDMPQHLQMTCLGYLQQDGTSRSVDPSNSNNNKRQGQKEREMFLHEYTMRSNIWDDEVANGYLTIIPDQLNTCMR